MLKNYLSTAFRIFARQRTYSFINILGLSIGLASSLLIFIYILDELSYDKHIVDGNNIYRAGITERFQGQDINYTSTPVQLAESMRKEIPGVNSSVRINRYTDLLIHVKEKSFIEQGTLMADSNFFEFFGIKFIEGDAKNSLKGPNKIVLTENLAKKYFGYKGKGDASPIGKIIEYGSNHSAAEVTGIIANIPHNTHMKFEMVISLDSWKYFATDDCWACYGIKTYFKLNPTVPISQVQTQLDKFVEQRILPRIEQDLNVTKKQMSERGDRVNFFIQSLSSIHLQSHNDDEFEANSDIRYIKLFGAIAFFIILIACINFINMATARAVSRAKEVGVRKTIGALRSWLVQQFMLESLLYVVTSAFVSLVIVVCVRKPFEILTSKEVGLLELTNPVLIIGSGILIVFVALISSGYPAFYLTSFKPVEVLRGNVVSHKGHSTLRRSLVIFQFGVSIALVISTLTIYKQLKFIQNQNLGFQKENIIQLADVGNLKKSANAFKNEILKHSEFVAASFTYQLPPNITNTTFIKAEGSNKLLSVYQFMADQDHLQTMGYQMKTGRYFSKDFVSDSNAIIINEACAKFIGYDNFVGKNITFGGPQKWNVIGIIKDFNFESLRNEIKPMIIRLSESPHLMAIRLSPGDPTEKIRVAQNIWNQFAPGTPFQYSFVDNNFDKQFKSEQQMGKLFLIFTGMAIFIACLGLFGLITFTADKRVKEIGIRKVLGASRTQIAGLLSAELLRLVIIAFFIAIPITWYSMNQWLQGFAYRTTFDFFQVLVAGMMGVVAAFLTVGYKCYSAASRNPAESIKNE